MFSLFEFLIFVGASNFSLSSFSAHFYTNRACFLFPSEFVILVLSLCLLTIVGMSYDSSSHVGHGQSMLQREVSPISEGSSTKSLSSFNIGVFKLKPCSIVPPIASSFRVIVVLQRRRRRKPKGVPPMTQVEPPTPTAKRLNLFPS